MQSFTLNLIGVFEEDLSCLASIRLSLLDQLIFWIGGSLIFLATTFLMLAAVRFKEVRAQPGDLILGVAISDCFLAVHWIVLSFYPEKVEDKLFCKVIGGIGAFAGTTEFLYNIAFSVFLFISLKNALTQVFIPRKAFHLIIIGLAGSLIAFCFLTDQIGRTQVGTCSIKSSCSLGFSGYFGLAITAVYALICIITYFNIKRDAPLCRRAHNKRTTFLLYYLCYIIASTLIYSTIATLNLTQSVLYSMNAKSETDIMELLKSFYNLSKLCCPLVLSIVRINDPFIKKVMRKTICCERRKSKNDNLVLQSVRTNNQILLPKIGTEESINSLEFTFVQLSADKKLELTYTLLSCVIYASEMANKISGSFKSGKRYIDNKKREKQYKQEQDYLIDDESLKNSLLNIKEELERKKLNIVPGSFKVYAPKVFGRLVRGIKYYDILASLDFHQNSEQIKNAGLGTGKSGQFFFFSSDNKFIIKTITNEELRTFVSILERYEKHFQKYPNSLLAKIYGLFRYESTEYNVQYNLILIQNTCGFPSDYIDRVYDLKGSRHGREVLRGQDITNRANLRNFVLKDLDFEKFEQNLYLDAADKRKFIEQIEADSLFLRNARLIDYSLVVSYVEIQRFENDSERHIDLNLSENALMLLENVNEKGIYYSFGIIDYLQPYTFRKAIERILKRLVRLNPYLETSTQNPEYYSERFIDFINNIIV